MSYRVNKQKCRGCGACMRNCPGAINLGVGGKAEIIDQEKLEECGGESVCPFGTIEKINGKPELEQSYSQPRDQAPPYIFPGPGRGMGRRIRFGRRMGVGRGIRFRRDFGMGRRRGFGGGRRG